MQGMWVVHVVQALCLRVMDECGAWDVRSWWCMYLARGGVGGEGDEWIVFGLYQSCGNRGVCWTCVCV